jgi:hypothetical protein
VCLAKNLARPFKELLKTINNFGFIATTTRD